MLQKKEDNYFNGKLNKSLFSKIHKSNFFHYLFRFFNLIKFLLKRIDAKTINLKIYLYNNNPAMVSILVGVYWCIIGFFLTFLSSKMDFKNTDISVKISPLFVKGEVNFSEISFNSIFYIRGGYIIITVFFIIYYKLWSLVVKRSDGFGRTPNRRFNQNRHGKH